MVIPNTRMSKAKTGMEIPRTDMGRPKLGMGVPWPYLCATARQAAWAAAPVRSSSSAGV